MNIGNLLITLCVLNVTRCAKKSKRERDILQKPPNYRIHQNNQLPHDKQITIFLPKGKSQTFYYWSPAHGSLSLTIDSCSSHVDWTIAYGKYNKSRADIFLGGYETNETKTFQWKADPGLYICNITSLYETTQVNIYLSTEPGGPQALKPVKRTLRLIRRQKRKKLTVRWNASLVDPQGTDYCLAVSTNRHYTSLCAAQMQRYGLLPYVTNNHRGLTVWEDKNDNKFDPTIFCVGPRTQYTFGELKQGQGYYFDLFAINRQSNLTYPYGSTYTVFNRKIKPTELKDGRTTFVSLKKLDGKAVFRYKVSKAPENSSLEIFVMPCGGAVDVEVTLKGSVVRTKRNIESFGRIIITNPKIKSNYYVRILSTNKEELRKLSGVEVYASTKFFANAPMPNMPSEPNVQEYTSLRKCDSVTIGWIPSPGQKEAFYCIVVREGKVKDHEGLKPPNQCGLESRLKKSADFHVKYCFDVKHDEKPVLIRRINQLKSGRSYTVQVTVKKPKGKTLSYDLIQAETLASCDT